MIAIADPWQNRGRLYTLGSWILYGLQATKSNGGFVHYGTQTKNIRFWVELVWRNGGFCHVLRCKSYLKKHLSTWQNTLFSNTSSTRASKATDFGRFWALNKNKWHKKLLRFCNWHVKPIRILIVIAYQILMVSRFRRWNWIVNGLHPVISPGQLFRTRGMGPDGGARKHHCPLRVHEDVPPHEDGAATPPIVCRSNCSDRLLVRGNPPGHRSATEIKPTSTRRHQWVNELLLVTQNRQVFFLSKMRSHLL